MKNNMFSGWKAVFLFTLRQSAGQKYKAITLILAIILFVGGFGTNIYLAMSQQKSDNISPIERVYLIDESEIAGINWDAQALPEREKFPKVCFEKTDSGIEELGKQLKDNGNPSVIAQIKKVKDRYDINIFIPYESEVSKKDAENLAKAIKGVVYEGLIRLAEIDEDKITYVVSDMKTEFSTIGENAKSDNLLLLTTVFPMVFMFGLYFMVIIYGQSMGQIVSIEKSSKLMEMLLVTTRPYGLIFGKILATATTAIVQMSAWIIAAVAGLILGDTFARNSIYSGYENKMLAMFSEVIADESTGAFTNGAITLTVIAVCLAFLFYCMLAGAISSFAGKADELGTVMMFYNMAIVIGFMGSYIIPSFVGQEWIKVMIRLIPMSAAFILPGEILLGTVSAKMAIVYLLVLLIWIVLTAVFAGKVYKDQVFFRGQSIKERLPWIKNSESEDSQEQWQILHDEAGRPLEKSQKIGYFFIAISPIAIFLMVQIFASLILTNIMTRVGLRGIDLDSWEVAKLADYYHSIEPTLNPLTVMCCHLLLITIFGLWLYWIRKGFSGKIIHTEFVKNKSFLSVLGVCLICGVSLCAFANGVVVIESEVIPTIVENYMKMAQSAGFGKSPFTILATVILAPIGEELLCRGVCLHFGKKAFGKFWYANLLQALLFGILHMNWVQGVYAFFIGLVLGILVERYDSLLPAMFVHFIVNFSSSTWMPKVLANVDLTFEMGIVLAAITSVITGVVLYLSRMSKE